MHQVNPRQKSALRPRLFTRVASVCHVLTAVLLLLAGACSTKKNTPMSRQWQAFTTRYNVYYNGDEHYKETLKAMEKAYEDDYTRTLLTHPAEAKEEEVIGDNLPLDPDEKPSAEGQPPADESPDVEEP